MKRNIINEIKKKNKSISLEKFVEISLFNKNGYYNNKKIIGNSGDFITAPEVSQLFGEILGLYIINIWKNHYKNKINIIEIGPGNGTLLNDILRITKSLFHFHDYIILYLIEKNNFLIQNQKKKLKKFNLKSKWYKNINNFKKIPSIFIANEFFDCLPIRQFLKIKDVWHEKMINYNEAEDRFFFENKKIYNKSLIKNLSSTNTDIIEISKKRDRYLHKIFKYISKYNGTAIIIDYGYDKPIRHSTVQAIHNHQNSNLLDNVGNQDITSLVDFKRFIDIAKIYNLKIDNYCSQKEFLLNFGIEQRKNKILEICSKNEKKEIEEGYKRLINENEMGSFKFLIVSNKTNNA